VSPGDLLYVGRYLTVGSTQGVTPDPSSLLTLRVTATTSLDVECEALSDAKLEGLVTIWHPGCQQQQRQQMDAIAAAMEQQHSLEEGGPQQQPGAAAARLSGDGGAHMGGDITEDAFGCVAATAPAATNGSGAAQLGRAADGSANYSLPILSEEDLAALKVTNLVGIYPGLLHSCTISESES
jgi:hypothetical protein